jgi:16S rRNA (cytidine1402-2'-O)-methyltransferase
VAGTLYVVATPIGNLEDLSARALRVLRSVSRIACEDTRRTAKLLARHEVSTPTVSCHSFNERKRVASLLERLRRGEDLALVSDAGTPGISDPGAILVRAALDAGFRVAPVPGPSAVMALLSASGLAGDRFVFEGYLPARGAERRRRLAELRTESRTLVLFEAPHRIRRTLQDLADLLGERTVVLGRELTKLHETILRGSARQLLESLEKDPIRGEFTLAIEGAPGGEKARETSTAAEEVRRVWREALREAEGDSRSALRLAARRLGLRRPALFRMLSELGETFEG